jgi:hypothetical protein
MAYARWKTDRNRRRVLIARWRDKSVPGGWKEERRPNDRTKEQAKEYAREREKHADLRAKGARGRGGRPDHLRSVVGPLVGGRGQAPPRRFHG